METYPSIPTEIINEPIYAFDKVDGSNFRAEWSRKSGFNKYGTRTRLLDPYEKPLGEAIELFEHKYMDELDQTFRKQRWEKATAFLEFYGESSFAGQHKEGEKHDVILFDVHVYKMGMLLPKEFLNIIAPRVETVPLLYKGLPNQEFAQKVKTGQLQGMTFEGVVCKGTLNKHQQVTMFKIKNRAWIDAVKAKYGKAASQWL